MHYSISVTIGEQSGVVRPTHGHHRREAKCCRRKLSFWSPNRRNFEHSRIASGLSYKSNRRPVGRPRRRKELRGLVCKLRNALFTYHFHIQVKILIDPSIPCERDLASIWRKRRHHLLSFEGRERYRNQRRISFCLLRLSG